MRIRFILSFYGLLIFCPEIYAGTAPWKMNGVVWDYYYHAAIDGLPTNAVPGWIQYHKTGTDAYLTNSVLRIDAAVGGATSFQLGTNNAGWDASNQATLEVTFRVVSSTGSSGAGGILIANGSFYQTMNIFSNSIKIGTTSASHDFTQLTTLRLTFDKMTNSSTAVVTGYINNQKTPMFSHQGGWTATVLHTIRFGNLNTSGHEGAMEWESIRWITGIYEPSRVLKLIVITG